MPGETFPGHHTFFRILYNRLPKVFSLNEADVKNTLPNRSQIGSFCIQQEKSIN